MAKKKRPTKKKKTVTLAPLDYQPSQAEMEEEIRIDASPEQLMKAVVQEARVKRRKQ